MMQQQHPSSCGAAQTMPASVAVEEEAEYTHVSPIPDGLLCGVCFCAPDPYTTTVAAAAAASDDEMTAAAVVDSSSSSGGAVTPAVVVGSPLLPQAAVVVAMPCGHLFCRSCLAAALRHRMECPLDRTPLIASQRGVREGEGEGGVAAATTTSGGFVAAASEDTVAQLSLLRVRCNTCCCDDAAAAATSTTTAADDAADSVRCSGGGVVVQGGWEGTLAEWHQTRHAALCPRRTRTCTVPNCTFLATNSNGNIGSGSNDAGVLSLEGQLQAHAAADVVRHVACLAEEVQRLSATTRSASADAANLRSLLYTTRNDAAQQHESDQRAIAQLQRSVDSLRAVQQQLTSDIGSYFFNSSSSGWGGSGGGGILTMSGTATPTTAAKPTGTGNRHLMGLGRRMADDGWSVALTNAYADNFEFTSSSSSSYSDALKSSSADCIGCGDATICGGTGTAVSSCTARRTDYGWATAVAAAPLDVFDFLCNDDVNGDDTAKTTTYRWWARLRLEGESHQEQSVDEEGMASVPSSCCVTFAIDGIEHPSSVIVGLSACRDPLLLSPSQHATKTTPAPAGSGMSVTGHIGMLPRSVGVQGTGFGWNGDEQTCFAIPLPATPEPVGGVGVGDVGDTAGTSCGNGSGGLAAFCSGARITMALVRRRETAAENAERTTVVVEVVVWVNGQCVVPSDDYQGGCSRWIVSSTSTTACAMPAPWGVFLFPAASMCTKNAGVTIVKSSSSQ